MDLVELQQRVEIRWQMNDWCKVLGERNLEQWYDLDSLSEHPLFGIFYMQRVMCFPLPFRVVLINPNFRNRSLCELVGDVCKCYVGNFLSDVDIQVLLGVSNKIYMMKESFQLSNKQNIYTTSLEILQCLNRPAAKFNADLERCNKLERGEIEI